MQDAAKHNQRLSPELRKQQLLELAVELLADQRHLPLSYDLLATKAGVTTPLIYNYFPDQVSLCNDIAHQELSLLLESFDDGDASLTDMIARYLAYVVQRGTALSIITADPSMKGKLLPATLMLRNAVIKKGARLIRQECGCTIREAILTLLSFMAIPDELAINIRQGALNQDDAGTYCRQLGQLTLRTLRKRTPAYA